MFNSNNRLRNFFGFKDKIPLSVRSHVLYRYTCDCCNAVYIGKRDVTMGYEYLST